VPIYALMVRNEFAPEEVEVLASAFEDVRRTLGLTNREDPATLMVAQKIIELAQSGERDPEQLRVRALESLAGPSRGSSCGSSDGPVQSS
jgi:hypothetical protein